MYEVGAHGASTVVDALGLELLLEPGLANHKHLLVLGELENLRQVHGRRVGGPKDLLL